MSEECHKCDGVGKLRKWGAFGEFKIIPCPECTVTVPRAEWERVKAVADEWDSLDTVLKAGLAADLSEIGFNEFVVNALISKMTKIQERFVTPSNAVEEGSNIPRANSVTGAEQEPQS